MGARKMIWFVFDASGTVFAAYSDESEARRLARYMGFDPDEFAGGVDSVELDRPVEAFALDDEHRA